MEGRKKIENYGKRLKTSD